MNKEKMFNRLVENAFDFLSQALLDIHGKPEIYSYPLLRTVELFVKARLMKEHWSLVISQKQEADWDKFIAGDFQSVTLTEANSKLQKVTQSGLSKLEFDSLVVGEIR